MKAIICSGHFNPLGVHHIKYLQDAKSRGDMLFVIVNSDEQIKLRGSCPFQDENERIKIVESLGCVDQVYLAIDKDGGISDTLEKIVSKYESVYSTLDVFTGCKQNIEWYFAKGGGDRKSRDELPIKEVETADRLGISLIFGVGGIEKSGASSSSLSNAFRWYLEQLEAMSYNGRMDYLKRVGYIGNMFN